MAKNSSIDKNDSGDCCFYYQTFIKLSKFDCFQPARACFPAPRVTRKSLSLADSLTTGLSNLCGLQWQNPLYHDDRLFSYCLAGWIDQLNWEPRSYKFYEVVSKRAIWEYQLIERFLVLIAFWVSGVSVVLLLFDPGWYTTVVPAEDHKCSSKHCYSIVSMRSCLRDEKQQHGNLKNTIYTTWTRFWFCIRNFRTDEPAGDAEHTK